MIQYDIIAGKISIDNVDSFILNIHQFGKKNQIFIQTFNADMIYGKKHLESSILHAIRAFRNDLMSTKSLDMEILLYASGERQLKHAIPKMGIKKGDIDLAITFVSMDTCLDLKKVINDFCSQFNIIRDDARLEGSKETLERFGISKNEYESLSANQYVNLILEKVAMVDIIK